MKEIWKDVIGYEGLYQVSNLGRVKGLKRESKHYKGGVRVYNERFLNPCLHKDGYLKVGLIKDGINKQHSVHRLVCSSFIENIYNKPQVNHKNGVKTDNRLENLEWSTSSENHKHAYKIGLRHQNGEKNHRSALTNSQVFEIKYNHKNLSNKEVSMIYNISTNQVSRIRRGDRWSHV